MEGDPPPSAEVDFTVNNKSAKNMSDVAVALHYWRDGFRAERLSTAWLDKVYPVPPRDDFQVPQFKLTSATRQHCLDNGLDPDMVEQAAQDEVSHISNKMRRKRLSNKGVPIDPPKMRNGHLEHHFHHYNVPVFYTLEDHEYYRAVLEGDSAAFQLYMKNFFPLRFPTGTTKDGPPKKMKKFDNLPDLQRPGSHKPGKPLPAQAGMSKSELGEISRCPPDYLKPCLHYPPSGLIAFKSPSSNSCCATSPASTASATGRMAT